MTKSRQPSTSHCPTKAISNTNMHPVNPFSRMAHVYVTWEACVAALFAIYVYDIGQWKHYYNTYMSDMLLKYSKHLVPKGFNIILSMNK